VTKSVKRINGVQLQKAFIVGERGTSSARFGPLIG
jgi:hypothetical protein